MGSAGGGLRVGGEPRGKGGALANFTGDRNRAAVGFDELACNGQAQTAAAAAAVGPCPVSLPKAVKDKGQIRRRDTGTSVAYGDENLRFLLTGTERHLTAGGGVPQRIGHEVAQHLIEAKCIAV